MSKIKTAGVFLINKKNELLICHPTRHADNIWSIPKGMIDEGETPLRAAIRETYEESNVVLPLDGKYHELPVQNYRSGKKAITGFVFLEKENLVDFNTFNLQCNSNVEPEKGGFPEVDEYKWLSLDQAGLLIHEAQRNSFESILKLIK